MPAKHELTENLLPVTGDPIDERKSLSPPLFPPLFLSFIACFGSILFGYTLGFTAPALQPMQNGYEGGGITPFKCEGYEEDEDKSDYGLCTSSPSSSIFSSLVNIGCLIGALLGGSISDALGRKRALLLSSLPFSLGWLGIANLTNPALLTLARVSTGLGVGVCSSNVPVYIAEVSPAKFRGGLGCMNQLGITVGIFAVYAVGLLTEKEVKPTGGPAAGDGETTYEFASWTEIAWLGCFVSVGFGALVAALLPETPSWLARSGDRGGAVGVLLKLRGKGAELTEEYETLVADAAASAGAAGDKGGVEDERGGFGELLQPELRRQLTLACALMVLQQFTGINAVIFYSTEIFTTAGVDGAEGSLIVMATQVVVTGIACLLVDKLGRRILLLLACMGMFLSSCSMTTFYFLKDSGNAVNPLALASMIVYIASFSVGMGAIPWLIMSEIFPGRVRGVAGSVATGVNWTSSFIMTLVFDEMNKVLGSSGTFLFFSCEIFVTFIFIYRNIPETKGKSLEEIQEWFNNK
ncbi:hypothetical protein TrCOL_g6050 [Triparma columacea]|uniref:Hexose transporter 1 n=1 Tax=Triparma columacea TaxID=722753 RepID=A0A9W7LB99_9STRA|nr:hypothetical protein TrCOL_g6050 [Triparma columacea]